MCEYVTVRWIQQEISPSLVYLPVPDEGDDGTEETEKALLVHGRYPKTCLLTVRVALVMWGGEYCKSVLSPTIYFDFVASIIKVYSLWVAPSHSSLSLLSLPDPRITVDLGQPNREAG